MRGEFARETTEREGGDSKGNEDANAGAKEQRTEEDREERAKDDESMRQ